MSIPSKKRPKVKVMFTIDHAVIERLDAVKERLNMSRSALVEHAIQDLIKELNASKEVADAFIAKLK